MKNTSQLGLLLLIGVSAVVSILAANAETSATGQVIVGMGFCYYGQLGIGPCGEVQGDSSYPVVVDGLNPDDIKSLQAGSWITGIQFNNNSLAGMGDNESGAIGTNTTDEKIYSPTPVLVTGTPLEGRVVTNLYVGGIVQFASLDDGSLVAWGSNFYGLLANGEIYQRRVPIPIVATNAEDLLPFDYIRCGPHNCFGVKNQRLVGAWGMGDQCSLGVYGCKEGFVFPYVTDPTAPFGDIEDVDIDQVSVGAFYTLVLDKTGQAWSVGASQHIGRLGNVTYFQPVNQSLIGAGSSDTTVTDIQAGSSHALMLTSGGRIFGFGHGYYGQLGNPVYNESSYWLFAIPTDMTPFGNSVVDQVYALPSLSLAKTTDGEVFAWGWDGKHDWGMLPTIHTNLTGWIAHAFYPTAGSPTAVFIRASVNPNPPSPSNALSPSVPMFGGGPPTLSVPTNPNAPIGDSSIITVPVATMFVALSLIMLAL
jgi:hypothetical protein